MNTAYKLSPKNLIEDWGYFEDWAAGDSVAPSGWKAVGTAGSVAKESTNKQYGNFSLKLISAAAATYGLESEIPNYDSYEGRTLRARMEVMCDTSSKARIYVADGISTTYSSYHTGGGAFETLEVEAQINQDNPRLAVGVMVAGGSITGYFDGGIVVEGETVITNFHPSSKRSYAREADWRPRVTFSVSQSEIPRREGTVIGDDGIKIKSKAINVRVELHDTDRDNARTEYDNYVKACLDGQKNLYLYDDRFLDVRLNNFTNLKFQADMKVYEFVLGFIAENPYEKYIGRERKTVVVSGTSEYFDVNVGGSVKNYPRLYVFPTGGTLSAFLLENYTTGEQFNYNGNVGAGVTLELDMEYPIDINLDGVDGSTNFSGDFLYLKPGVNHFKVTCDACTIHMDWFNRWL